MTAHQESKRSLAQDLRQFRENLTFHLEELYWQKKGVVRILYLDAGDLTDAVKGMHGFLEELNPMERDPAGKFDPRRRDPSAPDPVLVQCLVARGWLGPFQMLRPHQLEFRRLMLLRFGLGSIPFERTERDALRFAVEVAGAVETKGAGEGGMGRTRRQRLEAVLEGDTAAEQMAREQMRFARNRFKLIECVAGNWQTRLNQWHKNDLFRLDDGPPPEYGDMMEADSLLFERIKGAWDRVRPPQE